MICARGYPAQRYPGNKGKLSMKRVKIARKISDLLNIQIWTLYFSYKRFKTLMAPPNMQTNSLVITVQLYYCTICFKYPSQNCCNLQSLCWIKNAMLNHGDTFFARVQLVAGYEKKSHYASSLPAFHSINMNLE